MKVLSYNIWFDETLCLERTISLVNIISEYQPDVICLQEVRPDIHEILVMLLKNYKYSFPQKLTKRYECVTFSRHPIIKCLNYLYKNSGMGRSLSIVQISVNNTDVIVANSHFESLFKKTENTIKLKQYEMARALLDSLYESYHNVILCADTNVLLSEENKFNEQFKDNKWIDAWAIKGNDADKFTYDSDNNIYLKVLKDKYRSRIDRILFKTDSYDLDKFSLIKNPDMEPSDHFGIFGKFTIKS